MCRRRPDGGTRMDPSRAYATGHIDISMGLKKGKGLGEEIIFIKLSHNSKDSIK